MIESKKAQSSVLWATITLGFLWSLYRLLMNDGWILDDEISHYYFSRSVWENPEQIFNHWTRPGRNLLHVFVAPLGFTATRIFTLILSMVAVFATYRVGKILELPHAYLLPLLLMFQSWFPELSYPVLTQSPFMLVWILGIWAALKGRFHVAGFCFGYLSLIRHEGILLSGLWGLWVSFQSGGLLHQIWASLAAKRNLGCWSAAIRRDTFLAMSTVSAIVIYNLAAWLSTGHWPFAIYFESKPTTMYGSGTLFHYLPLLLMGVGVVSSFLMAIGVLSLRKVWSKWSLILVSYGFYFIAHSLIYWKGAFASGGYYHFIMPMAPAIALLSAMGLTKILALSQSLFSSQKTQGALCCLICFASIAQGLNMAHHQINYQNWARIMHEGGSPDYHLIAPPLQQGMHSKTIIEASKWATAEADGPVFAKHVAHNFHQGNLATPHQINAENAHLYQMPVGTYFIWDSLYCEFENRLKFSSFVDSQDWEILKSWKFDYPMAGSTEAKDIYRVVVFKKVSQVDTQDKQYDELGEADKVDQIYE